MVQQVKTHCPVCGYTQLSEPAYDKSGLASFQVCPCCGTQFGYDDATTTHDALRERWMTGGKLWWSSATPPPRGWNPEEQLKTAQFD